jgi:hypothetical protein
MAEECVGASAQPGFVSQEEIDRVINGDASVAAQAARVGVAMAPAVLTTLVGGPILGAVVFGLGFFIPKAMRAKRRHEQLEKLKQQGFVPKDACLREVRDLRNMLKT